MNQPESPIVGIDLGTTNSAVAALIDGQVQVIREDGESLLPSVVAMTPAGKLIVGQSAKNQMAAFSDRTIASIKRRMGEAVKLSMAGEQYTPQEISALILRRLKERASHALGTDVTRAVITVPAFFDEPQRQATREAGQLAGLTVERIINEPTAASLVYHADSSRQKHLIVYDLGGGTFDVSIVRLEHGVVEVLSSRGDTKLGGDDFDELLTKHVADAFFNEYDHDLTTEPVSRWRLMHACERAKCELSTSTSIRVAEEFIATIDGKPVNLDVEVTRHEYEQMIGPLVEKTISCVDEAIRDSSLTTSQLDELILVGGSTRTPLVQQRLREEFQREPLWSINPDLAVAMGAATQAAMQQGHSIGPVLIDVATHTLGIEVLDSYSFSPKLKFAPLIHRNSPLPARYEDTFQTVTPDQEAANIDVYQGESTELHRNHMIGHLRLDGLNEAANADGTIVVRFELTLDGTLEVTAIERASGLTERLKIDNALSRVDQEVRAEMQQRLGQLFGQSDEMKELQSRTIDVQDVSPSPASQSTMRVDSAEQPVLRAHQLVAKARSLRDSLHEEDVADVDRLIELIGKAEGDDDRELVEQLESELDDLLFYLAE